MIVWSIVCSYCCSTVAAWHVRVVASVTYRTSPFELVGHRHRQRILISPHAPHCVSSAMAGRDGLSFARWHTNTKRDCRCTLVSSVLSMTDRTRSLQTDTALPWRGKWNGYGRPTGGADGPATTGGHTALVHASVALLLELWRPMERRCVELSQSRRHCMYVVGR